MECDVCGCSCIYDYFEDEALIWCPICGKEVRDADDDRQDDYDFTTKIKRQYRRNKVSSLCRD